MRRLSLIAASLFAALFLMACEDAGDGTGAPPPAAPEQAPPAAQ